VGIEDGIKVSVALEERLEHSHIYFQSETHRREMGVMDLTI
jgi:hypothetical protein